MEYKLKLFFKGLQKKYDQFTKYFNNDINYDVGLLNALSKFPTHNLITCIARYS